MPRLVAPVISASTLKVQNSEAVFSQKKLLCRIGPNVQNFAEETRGSTSMSSSDKPKHKQKRHQMHPERDKTIRVSVLMNSWTLSTICLGPATFWIRLATFVFVPRPVRAERWSPARVRPERSSATPGPAGPRRVDHLSPAAPLTAAWLRSFARSARGQLRHVAVQGQGQAAARRRRRRRRRRRPSPAAPPSDAELVLELLPRAFETASANRPR